MHVLPDPNLASVPPISSLQHCCSDSCKCQGGAALHQVERTSRPSHFSTIVMIVMMPSFVLFSGAAGQPRPGPEAVHGQQAGEGGCGWGCRWLLAGAVHRLWVGAGATYTAYTAHTAYTAYTTCTVTVTATGSPGSGLEPRTTTHRASLVQVLLQAHDHKVARQVWLCSLAREVTASVGKQLHCQCVCGV